MDPVFVLVHSPLVGPFSWSAVADQLRRTGREAIIPGLADQPDRPAPFWQQHAESVARQLHLLAPDQEYVLVGHSGAGALLPAIRDLSGCSVTAYVFVDAGIPNDGEPRLGPSANPSPFALQLRPVLDDGGTYPNWSADDLASLIPDQHMRQQLLAGLRPRGLAFWAEPIPVFDGWPDAPCAYLHFNPAYNDAAERAQADGWRYEKLDGGHFHMLVEPGAVAAALIRLAEPVP